MSQQDSCNPCNQQLLSIQIFQDCLYSHSPLKYAVTTLYAGYSGGHITVEVERDRERERERAQEREKEKESSRRVLIEIKERKRESIPVPDLIAVSHNNNH